MTLTWNMVIKYSEWYLQVSETPSIRIHWLRLRLASLFCAPILFSRYIKHFYFDLTFDVIGDTEVIKGVPETVFKDFKMPL